MNDLDPEARRVVQLARAARTPGAHDKARVERRLALALGASATAAAAVSVAQAGKTAAATQTLAGLAVSKVWLGVGSVLVVALTGSVWLSQPAAKPSAGHTKSAVVAAARPSMTPTAAPLSPTPVVQTEHAAQPAAATALTTASPDASVRARTRDEHRPASGASTGLDAELDLLHRAQSAWRAREARRALSLLREHRARYPHSALQLERDTLQVLTLCDLGKQVEAKRLAHSVLLVAPQSPLRTSLEQSCAIQ